MKRLLIATRSQGKRPEIRDLFSSSPFDIVFPDDIGLDRLPQEATIETGETFAENAVLKARYFAGRSGLPTIGEDSGIVVDALGGEPGVRSARWSGATTDVDQANNRLLLERLRGVPPEQRTARYRSAVAFVETPDAEPLIVEAATEGRILGAPEGTGGFGYDPLFFSDDLGGSFGVASLEDKQRVSHRGRALRGLLQILEEGARF